MNQKNTGAVQININGTTNKDVMKYGSDGVLKAVDAGDFVANSPVLCLYDGTRFVVIGITSASSITVTGEAGDILQIADDGTIESSGKKAAQPNGIATLDENGNVVQVANMANSAAAVYSGEPVTIEYADAQRIASITAYGENAQGGTTEAPVALTGVDSVQVCGNNLLPDSAKTVAGDNIRYFYNTDGFLLLKGQAYTLVTNINSAGIYIKSSDDSSEIAVRFQAKSVTYIPDTNVRVFFDVYWVDGVPDGALVWLNLGESPLPYEPYQGSVTPLPIPRPLRRVGDVRDVCVTRQEYEGTEKLVVTYNVGFVELDGTESNLQFNSKYQTLEIKGITTSGDPSQDNAYGVCISSHFALVPPGTSTNLDKVVYGQPKYNQIIIHDTSWNSLETAKAYLAAQKAAGTPVQIAYQLATPEVYATDPVDFDNAAGPLTVVTGGQVEVKMTDFVTDRTPAFLNKLDKTGDGSDVTVTFTEAATDTDIASGDKLSILFGKILKRFSTITSKFTTVDNSITQIESDISDITDGTTVVAQANKVTNALVIMSNSGTALVNYDGSTTANMTLSPSNVGAEPAFTKNTAFNKNFGSSAGTVCQGNDGRLSNARRSSNISMSLSGTNLSISYS